MYRLLFLFFFLSGFTSLVFEVIWERMLMQVFGSTSLALSTLLTAFMAGLALGAVVGGKVARKLKRPLRVYGLLEAGVGLWALVVPFLLEGAQVLYAAMFASLSESMLGFALARFAIIFLILVVPTTMMGASLPIVSQWIARHGAYEGRVGWLYATNTFGAFSGTVAAGFFLLPALGLSTTNHIFAASNVLLCVLVLAAEKAMDRAPTEHPQELDELLAHVEVKPLSGRSQMGVALAFLGAGMVAMTYQILWTRAYVIVLGSSTYSFTMILACFLLATAAGSTVAGALVRRIARPIAWLALSQSLFAVAALGAFLYLEELPELLFHRFREEIRTPQEIWLYQFGLVAALIFVPIALQGMAFPLVIRALQAKAGQVGAAVGRIYGFNTLGAILGSFTAGFVLLPTLGLRGALTFAVSLNLAIALIFLGVSAYQGVRHRAHIGVAAAVLLCVLGLSFGPSVDQVKLTRGMFRTYWARELFDPEKLARDRPELVFYADGALATITVEKRGKLVTLKSNGKPEASDGADMATQILVALSPFLVRSMHPEFPPGGEVVAMVGYGSGVTAGGALQWPLKTLDVVEIEKEMVGASAFFNHVNHRPLDDPRTRLIESDGRNFLEFTPTTYDIIVSEPSNPWIAGVASLFTVEHFERARRKLAPGGVFSQWVQLYEMSPENVRRIIATFTSVFPYVQGFSSMPKGTDLILIGSNSPMTFAPRAFERAWEIPSIQAELRRAGMRSEYDLIGLMFMNHDELVEFGKGAELNTDDNGLLEFEAPKDLIRYDVGQQFFQDHYFSRDDYGDARRHLENWPNWPQDEVGKLASAVWRAGKPALAQMLLDDAGIEPLSAPPSEPFTPLEQMLLVQHASSLDLDRAVVELWPVAQSAFHQTAIDAVRGEKHLQAMMWLEADGQPPRGGYSGEKGLLYAYVLARRHYYKHALEQLDGLRDRNDPLVQTPLYELLSGFVNSKRRRYNESFTHYLEASRLLQEKP